MANNTIDKMYSIFLNQAVTVVIDRSLHSKHPKHGFVYELNYGYVPDTLAPDGEEIDAYVIGVDQPIKTFTGRCIAVIHRLNDQDDKLIIVPEGTDFTDEQIIEATYFQERFFRSTIYRTGPK
jgi:inorganic pyrophosphatase